MSEQLAKAMSKIIEVLNPLDSAERRRVIQAAFALLGEEPVTKASYKTPLHESEEVGDEAVEGIAPAASAWMSKAKIMPNQLEQHLHWDTSGSKVLSLPGNATKRVDQVLHVYLMQGVASFLTAGDPSFSDKDARDLCVHFGCYDDTNHAKYVKAFGNRITGSKNSGWKLTAPGLAAVAELIKQSGS